MCQAITAFLLICAFFCAPFSLQAEASPRPDSPRYTPVVAVVEKSQAAVRACRDVPVWAQESLWTAVRAWF